MGASAIAGTNERREDLSVDALILVAGRLYTH